MKKGEAETLAGFILEISGNSQWRARKFLSNCLFTIETVDKTYKTDKVTVDV
jgi:hypothetical protein